MNHHTTSRNILSIVQAAMIAALYIVLTALAAGFDLASGAIQVRFSEVLTILPFFTPAAIPGVTIGCLLANILTGSALPDIIFGTLATPPGALGTYALRLSLHALPGHLERHHHPAGSPLCLRGPWRTLVPGTDRRRRRTHLLRPLRQHPHRRPAPAPRPTV